MNIAFGQFFGDRDCISAPSDHVDDNRNSAHSAQRRQRKLEESDWAACCSHIASLQAAAVGAVATLSEARMRQVRILRCRAGSRQAASPETDHASATIFLP
jgi:hypothetical protein